MKACCNHKKKYFNDPTLNSITNKISLGRREIFIDIINKYEIENFKDLCIKCIEKHEILSRLQEAEKCLIFKKYYEDESQLKEVQFEVKPYKYAYKEDYKDYQKQCIVLFGIKGEGKRSFVNTLCSYFNGCGMRGDRVIYQRENQFRFIIEEQNEQNQPILIHSDTLKKILKIYIIQDPESDVRTDPVSVVRTLKNINEIHVLGFVGSQQQGSLSQEQLALLKNVCSQLPKTIKDYIFHFITFSDMVEMARGYYQEEFQFLKDQSYQVQNEAVSGKRKGFIVNIQFERTIKNLQSFIEQIRQYQPQNVKRQIQEIQDCRQVLMENMEQLCQIETDIQKVNQQIQKLELNLKKEEIVREQNKNYKYTEAASKYTQQKLPTGKQATVCHYCNSTCCMSCEAQILQSCTQFNSDTCAICGCSLTKHKLVDYRIQVQIIQLEKEIKEMKTQFEIAEQKITELHEQIKEQNINQDEKERQQKVHKEVIEKCKKFINEEAIIGA